MYELLDLLNEYVHYLWHGTCKASLTIIKKASTTQYIFATSSSYDAIMLGREVSWGGRDLYTLAWSHDKLLLLVPVQTLAYFSKIACGYGEGKLVRRRKKVDG